MSHTFYFDKTRHVLVPLLPCGHAYHKDPTKSIATPKGHQCVVCRQAQKHVPVTEEPGSAAAPTPVALPTPSVHKASWGRTRRPL